MDEMIMCKGVPCSDKPTENYYPTLLLYRDFLLLLAHYFVFKPAFIFWPPGGSTINFKRNMVTI